MSIINKYYWIIPLIGGVFSLIGLLFPAWYSPPTWIEYVWIIGIIHHVTAGNVIDIAPSEMFIPSIITAIFISLSSIMIILNTSFKLRGKKLLFSSDNLWILLAIVEIGATIFYIVALPFAFFLHTDLQFSDFYIIQFGLFIPLFGAALTLIGGIIGKLLKRD